MFLPFKTTETTEIRLIRGIPVKVLFRQLLTGYLIVIMIKVGKYM